MFNVKKCFGSVTDSSSLLEALASATSTTTAAFERCGLAGDADSPYPSRRVPTMEANGRHFAAAGG